MDGRSWQLASAQNFPFVLYPTMTSCKSKESKQRQIFQKICRRLYWVYRNRGRATHRKAREFSSSFLRFQVVENRVLSTPMERRSSKSFWMNKARSESFNVEWETRLRENSGTLYGKRKQKINLGSILQIKMFRLLLGTCWLMSVLTLRPLESQLFQEMLWRRKWSKACDSPMDLWAWSDHIRFLSDFITWLFACFVCILEREDPTQGNLILRRREHAWSLSCSTACMTAFQRMTSWKWWKQTLNEIMLSLPEIL